MVDILHRIGVASSPEDVFAALTTVDGLTGWWTEETTGDGDLGGTLQFRFGPHGGFEQVLRDVVRQHPALHLRRAHCDRQGKNQNKGRQTHGDFPV